jgi:hypothetical protein
MEGVDVMIRKFAIAAIWHECGTHGRKTAKIDRHSALVLREEETQAGQTDTHA